MAADKTAGLYVNQAPGAMVNFVEKYNDLVYLIRTMEGRGGIKVTVSDSKIILEISVAGLAELIDGSALMGEAIVSALSAYQYGERQIALADEASAAQEQRKRSADAGTARTLGFRPGDTEPITRDRNTSEQFDLQRRLQNFGIRQQSFQNILNAYNSISPSGLQGAANTFGQQAQLFGQQASQPNPFLNAAVQYGAAGGFGPSGFNVGTGNTGTVKSIF